MKLPLVGALWWQPTHIRDVYYSSKNIVRVQRLGFDLITFCRYTEMLESDEQCCQVRLLETKSRSQILSVAGFWACYSSVGAYLCLPCSLYEPLLFLSQLSPIKRNMIVCPVPGSVHDPVPLVTAPNLPLLPHKHTHTHAHTYASTPVTEWQSERQSEWREFWAEWVWGFYSFIYLRSQVASLGLVSTDLAACFSGKIWHHWWWANILNSLVCSLQEDVLLLSDLSWGFHAMWHRQLKTYKFYTTPGYFISQPALNCADELGLNGSQGTRMDTTFYPYLLKICNK